MSEKKIEDDVFSPSDAAADGNQDEWTPETPVDEKNENWDGNDDDFPPPNVAEEAEDDHLAPLPSTIQEDDDNDVTDMQKVISLLKKIVHAQDRMASALERISESGVQFGARRTRTNTRTNGTQTGGNWNDGRPQTGRQPRWGNTATQYYGGTNNTMSGPVNPPTYAEVMEYAQQINAVLNAEQWFNFYSRNGWKTKRGPITTWKKYFSVCNDNEIKRSGGNTSWTPGEGNR